MPDHRQTAHKEIAPIPKNASEPAIQSSAPPAVINAKFFNTRNLSIVVSGLVLTVALLKADSKDIPKIVDTIVNSQHISIIGWIIAGIILIASVACIKIMSKIYDKEIERLVNERDQLQKLLLEKHQERT
jgi:hypothetical protein